MSRRPALVTQADLARALRAFEACGVKARVVFRSDGTAVVEPVDDAPATAPGIVEHKREIVL